jgi:RimJ/RimL family protein N-acetyltransferase
VPYPGHVERHPEEVPVPSSPAPAALKPSYPIETERLVLRPFVPEDFDGLFAIHSRPDVARYLYWGPRDEQDVREVLAQKAGRSAPRTEGGSLNLAAVLRDTGTLVGDVSLFWLSREHRQGEIGFVFHPDHGGRGWPPRRPRRCCG